MLTLLPLVLLGQVVVAPPATPPAPTWGAPVTWTQAGERKQAWPSPILVAEQAPTDAGAAAIRAVDARAVVELARPTMRLWRVTSAAAVRAKLPALLPVLHDLPSTASRLRVPVGVVCNGERVALPGLAALARVSSQPGCLPDFWMKAVTK
jgi:hypothetical protein